MKVKEHKFSCNTTVELNGKEFIAVRDESMKNRPVVASFFGKHAESYAKYFCFCGRIVPFIHELYTLRKQAESNDSDSVTEGPTNKNEETKTVSLADTGLKELAAQSKDDTSRTKKKLIN